MWLLIIDLVKTLNNDIKPPYDPASAIFPCLLVPFS